MIMKKLKESQQRVIKRSQIRLNPSNPKTHEETAVKFQMKNMKKNGYLGGVQWNERTGNLIDGHRRVLAMDLYYKYDGTAETDYDIRLEVVDFDEKTEKEQMTYEAAGSTKPDHRAIAEYIGDLDVENLGLSEVDLNDIMSLRVDAGTPVVEEIEGFLEPPEEAVEEDYSYEPSYEERKAKIKEAKAQTREKTEREAANEQAFLVLSFSTSEAKEALCEMLGLSPAAQYAKGEDFLRMIE